MTTRRCQGYFLAMLFGALLNAAGVFLSVGYAAQVTTNITSSGLGTTLNGSTTTPCVGGTCNITGGTPMGSNLFHSFGQFSVGTNNTANFSVANTIQNIISRVPGGVGSQIDGTLTSTISAPPTISSANLFLLNPAGILFGQNAKLNVGGSFHATTADYIKLGTDGVVYADT